MSELAHPRREYVSYLAMLQEKNRLLKKMRRKDTGQLQLERREQGFALYLNGANLPGHRKEPRTSKTSGSGVPEGPVESVEEPGERAKTAPSKRKSWSHKSLLLKAEGGTPVQIPAPGILSGTYEDDFEDSNLQEEEACNSEGEELALSMEDVSRLRASLEADSTLSAPFRRSPDSLSDSSTLCGCSEELDDPSPPPVTTATQSLTPSPLEELLITTDDDDNRAGSGLSSVCEPRATASLDRYAAGKTLKEDTVSIITTKVKTLSIKKQHYLLQLLQGLEKEEEEGPDPTSQQQQQQPQPQLSSRPASGRTSRLRGELLLARKPNPFLVSQSDPHLPTFLDNTELPSPVVEVEEERSRTATLGRRRHLLSTSSELVLLPCVSPEEDHTHLSEYHTPLESPPLQIEGMFSLDGIAPQICDSEPRLLSSMRRGGSRDDLNGCLASITEFDHSHLGQIGSGAAAADADTILEDFLREHRHQSEGTFPPPPPPPPPQEHNSVPGDFPSAPGDFPPTPVLPSGRTLLLRVASTWGDRHYVGLTGIEIFTAPHGRPASIADITADPADINVLPEYSRDPRVVGNLLDGVNRTQDDLHMWLAPFRSGQTITIHFSHFTSVALIRIWNYSKSRIHSSRGVQGLDMLLDGALIFHGEVSRGASETVLFTTSEELLQRVSRHDETFQRETAFSPSSSGSEEEEELSRPGTGSGEQHSSDGIRPLTCAASSQEVGGGGGGGGVVAREVQLVLAESWGDPSSLGLTGVQLQPPHTQLVGAVSSEEGGDNVQTLFDGENLTTDPAHMWRTLSPHPHTLTLSLATPSLVDGVKVWNYNSSPEDSYSGVKLMHVFVDGVKVSPETGFLLRKAPGHLLYDFGQLISFREPPPPLHDPPAHPGCPTGFVFQLQLLSTWGDPYYIGLNGIELLDGLKNPIPLTADNVAAHPASVNVLPGVEGDVRTPDKLVDGHYDTELGCHMWLAPLLPQTTHNSVFVLFDSPRCVSAVRLWNYSKTTSRGVREFAVLVDGLLVLQTSLPAAQTGGILPTVRGPLLPSTFWLSSTEHREGTEAVCGGASSSNRERPLKPAVNQAMRPKTSVTLHHT